MSVKVRVRASARVRVKVRVSARVRFGDLGVVWGLCRLVRAGFGLGWYGFWVEVWGFWGCGWFLGLGWDGLCLRVGVLGIWARWVVLGHGGLGLGIWGVVWGLCGPALGLGGMGFGLRCGARHSSLPHCTGRQQTTRHGSKRHDS